MFNPALLSHCSIKRVTEGQVQVILKLKISVKYISETSTR